MVLVNESPEIGSHIIQFLERRLHTSFERLFISNFSPPVPWAYSPWHIFPTNLNLPLYNLLLLFSHSVMSGSFWLHGLQHARLPCPSLSPGVCSNSCPLSLWCYPTISSSVTLSPSTLNKLPLKQSYCYESIKQGTYSISSNELTTLS